MYKVIYSILFSDDVKRFSDVSFNLLDEAKVFCYGLRSFYGRHAIHIHYHIFDSDKVVSYGEYRLD